MVTGYVVLKLVHIFIAIVALGTSAGLGIVLEFYGNHPDHGVYVLRMIYRLVALVVIPGYLLMLVTGAWLTHLSWSFTTHWIQVALALWLLGALFLGVSLAMLRKQIALFEANGPSSPVYKRMSFVERLLGGGGGLVIVAILYFMVVKPTV